MFFLKLFAISSLALSLIGAGLDFAAGLPYMGAPVMNSSNPMAISWSLSLLGAVILITGIAGLSKFADNHMQIFGGLMTLYGLIMVGIGFVMYESSDMMLGSMLLFGVSMLVVGVGMLVNGAWMLHILTGMRKASMLRSPREV